MDQELKVAAVIILIGGLLLFFVGFLAYTLGLKIKSNIKATKMWMAILFFGFCAAVAFVAVTDQGAKYLLPSHLEGSSGSRTNNDDDEDDE